MERAIARRPLLGVECILIIFSHCEIVGAIKPTRTGIQGLEARPYCTPDLAGHTCYSGRNINLDPWCDLKRALILKKSNSCLR